MDAYTLSEFEGPRVMKRKYQYNRQGRRAHGDFTCKTPRAAFLNFTTRMDWVYRRSGLAMFITTSTTCLAFLCLLLTPLPGPRSFGIFGELPRHRLPQHLILTPLPRYRTRHQHGTFAPSLPLIVHSSPSSLKARMHASRNPRTCAHLLGFDETLNKTPNSGAGHCSGVCAMYDNDVRGCHDVPQPLRQVTPPALGRPQIDCPPL